MCTPESNITDQIQSKQRKVCIVARCCTYLTKHLNLCTLCFYSSHVKQVKSLHRQRIATLGFHEIIVSAVTRKTADLLEFPQSLSH